MADTNDQQTSDDAIFAGEHNIGLADVVFQYFSNPNQETDEDDERTRQDYEAVKKQAIEAILGPANSDLLEPNQPKPNPNIVETKNCYGYCFPECSNSAITA